MNKTEKQLLEIFRQLDGQGRNSLLDFGLFLQGRHAATSLPVSEPNVISAKEGETVVGALKRLSQSYPMLDKSKMLNETSVLVTQHVMQGRGRTEVIEELELVFKKHYQRLKEGQS
ncbi:MAG: Crp/Fnr family transcriptional regulator [Gammaproteobacteria bacterium]|nr:Crp/Fnr family transcriptional regulator [Gammaproteobacteria bacterium]